MPARFGLVWCVGLLFVKWLNCLPCQTLPLPAKSPVNTEKLITAALIFDLTALFFPIVWQHCILFFAPDFFESDSMVFDFSLARFFDLEYKA